MSIVLDQSTLPGVTEPVAEGVRARFRQPVTAEGFIDAAWWPRTRSLVDELPGFLDGLWSAGRDITRVTYHSGAWGPAPRKMYVSGRLVRLGGFTSGDLFTVRLSDAWGRERIDVLVVPVDATPAVAERMLELAAESGSTYRAGDIVALAEGTPA
jgi:hypothetical protein